MNISERDIEELRQTLEGGSPTLPEELARDFEALLASERRMNRTLSFPGAAVIGCVAFLSVQVFLGSSPPATATAVCALLYAAVLHRARLPEGEGA